MSRSQLARIPVLGVSIPRTEIVVRGDRVSRPLGAYERFAERLSVRRLTQDRFFGRAPGASRRPGTRLR